eukprot:1162106-Pelagomonas_calceolata.AAC.9
MRAIMLEAGLRGAMATSFFSKGSCTFPSSRLHSMPCINDRVVSNDEGSSRRSMRLPRYHWHLGAHVLFPLVSFTSSLLPALYELRKADSGSIVNICLRWVTSAEIKDGEKKNYVGNTPHIKPSMLASVPMEEEACVFLHFRIRLNAKHCQCLCVQCVQCVYYPRLDRIGYRHVLLQLSYPRRQLQLCNPFLSFTTPVNMERCMGTFEMNACNHTLQYIVY